MNLLLSPWYSVWHQVYSYGATLSQIESLIKAMIFCYGLLFSQVFCLIIEKAQYQEIGYITLHTIVITCLVQNALELVCGKNLEIVKKQVQENLEAPSSRGQRLMWWEFRLLKYHINRNEDVEGQGHEISVKNKD